MNQRNLVQKAVVLLASCLDAVKIPYKVDISRSPQFTVPRKDGSGDLLVGVVAEDKFDADDAMHVLAGEVISHHRPTADAVFHAITQMAGYGMPTAIDRGPEPTIKPGRKTARPYGDDPDHVIFRETVFRNVINPGTEVYKKLDPVVTTCCRFFYMKNRDLCVKLGYEMQDLKTYAQVWTANFWSTGRVLRPKKDENERLLYRFLRQRFAEFYAQLRDRRYRNVVHDSQSVSLGLGIEFKFDSDGFGKGNKRNGGTRIGDATAVRSTEHSDPFMHRIVSVQDGGRDEEDEAVFQRYKEQHAEITTTNPKKRAKQAAQLLEEGLASLSHEDLVENLTRVSKSKFVCPDTRKEALKRLTQHQKSCSACSKVTPLPLNPDALEAFVISDVVEGENESTTGDDRLCVNE